MVPKSVTPGQIRRQEREVPGGPCFVIVNDEVRDVMRGVKLHRQGIVVASQRGRASVGRRRKDRGIEADRKTP